MVKTATKTHISKSGKRVPCHAVQKQCYLSGHQKTVTDDVASFKKALDARMVQEATQPQKRVVKTVQNTPPTRRRPDKPMFLHGTNTPLALGTIISSAGERHAKTAYSNSDPTAVYAAYTDWAKNSEHENSENLSNPLWRHEDNPAAHVDAPTSALASAMRYGINTAANRGIHKTSRSQLPSEISIDGPLSGDTGISEGTPSADDVERYNRNRPQSSPAMVTDEQWETMTSAEQDEYNAEWEEYQQDSETAPPPPLRGYWVFKVEPIRGEVQPDQQGHSSSDTVIKNGALKVVDVIVWDGIVVSEQFDAPPSLAQYPEMDDTDKAAIEAWRGTS